MASLIKPGPIKHIHHLWHPSEDDWRKDAVFAKLCVESVLHEVSAVKQTLKVDDAMSILVGNDKSKGPFIAYKTGQRMYSIDEIEKSYSEKPHVRDKLVKAFPHAEYIASLAGIGGIFTGVSWSVQLGILTLDDERDIKPNVVGYQIWGGYKAKFSSSFLLTSYDDEMNPTTNNQMVSSFMGRDTLILDTGIWTQLVEQVRHSSFFNLYEVYDRLCRFDFELLDTYSGHAEYVKKFLEGDKFDRSARDSVNVTSYRSLVDRVWHDQVEFASTAVVQRRLEKFQPLIKDIDDRADDIISIIKFVDDLHQAYSIIEDEIARSSIYVQGLKHTDQSVKEGVVFSIKDGNAVRVLKVTTSEFRRLNREKWDA